MSSSKRIFSEIFETVTWVTTNRRPAVTGQFYRRAASVRFDRPKMFRVARALRTVGSQRAVFPFRIHASPMILPRRTSAFRDLFQVCSFSTQRNLQPHNSFILAKSAAFATGVCLFSFGAASVYYTVKSSRLAHKMPHYNLFTIDKE